MNYSYQGRHPPSQLAAMAAIMNPTQLEELPWFADSGANNHVISDLENLTLQEPFKADDEVAVGNGLGLSILNTGSSTHFYSQKPFKFKNILHCPNAAANLLSIQKFYIDNNCWFKLTDTYFFVKDNLTGQTIMQGLSKDDLYPIKLFKLINKVKTFTSLLGISASASVWHWRLGHPTSRILNKVIKFAHILVIQSNKQSVLCDACQLAKAKTLPFSGSTNVTNGPLEITHSDLWTYPVLSTTGFKYYVVFIDNFSRFTWTYPIKIKSKTFDSFVNFKNQAKNLLFRKIKAFQYDGGG